MRPAFRIPGDTNGTAGSFASYAELADDRESLLVQLDAVKAEIDQLRAWKAEAMKVLALWEQALAVTVLFIDGGTDAGR